MELPGMENADLYETPVKDLPVGVRNVRPGLGNTD